MHLREVGTVGGQRSGSLTRGSPRSTGRPTGTERGSQVQPKREGPSGLCCGEGLRDKGGSKLGWAPSRSPGPGLLGGPEQDACPLWARPLPWCSPGHGPQSAPVSFRPPCSHFTPAEATRGKSRGEQRPRAQSTARRWGQPRTQGLQKGILAAKKEENRVTIPLAAQGMQENSKKTPGGEDSQRCPAWLSLHPGSGARVGSRAGGQTRGVAGCLVDLREGASPDPCCQP